MKKKHLLVALGFMLATATPLCVNAQDSSTTGITDSYALTVKGEYETSDGTVNCKNFVVETQQAGNYYAEFWLLPAKYADNTFTTFSVYVNDEYVGAIRPSSGNWQSARLENAETIALAQGCNTITIATQAPEFPEVETVRVALNDAEAVINAGDYEEYLENACMEESYPVASEQNGISTMSLPKNTNGVCQFNNIPLAYTFYKRVTLTQGQNIFITSSSVAAHDLDVVYFGSPSISMPSSAPARTGIGPTIIQPGGNPYLKPDIIYTPATSEETQGLNWKGISESAINSTMQVATVRMTVPKSGIYLVRVRTRVSGAYSVADLNINGEYFYENVPITFYKVNCTIPADGNEYATMTCCATYTVDDPFLFIHGGAGDRIVGVNDDGPDSRLNEYGLSLWDSYIKQRYYIPTSAISISSYSSSKPVSTCAIIARLNENGGESNNLIMNRKEVTSNIENTTADNTIAISYATSRNNAIAVIAKERLNRVSAYGLSGRLLGSANIQGTSALVDLADLNVTMPGFYVITVDTDNSSVSKKIVVK